MGYWNDWPGCRLLAKIVRLLLCSRADAQPDAWCDLDASPESKKAHNLPLPYEATDAAFLCHGTFPAQ